jgi:hypothetical protein
MESGMWAGMTLVHVAVASLIGSVACTKYKKNNKIRKKP